MFSEKHFKEIRLEALNVVSPETHVRLKSK